MRHAPVPRVASPAQIHALSPTNPQVLQLQSEDPNLQILHALRTSLTWQDIWQPDHGLQLEALMIYQDNVVWVQYQPKNPKLHP